MSSMFRTKKSLPSAIYQHTTSHNIHLPHYHPFTHTYTLSCTLQRNVPFTEWFQLAPVQSYHKSLPLEDFLAQLAPERWPPGKRTGYCYRAYKSNIDDCEMKSGNPFGPFWDELGVDFDTSEFTGLSYDVYHDSVLRQWQERSALSVVNHAHKYTIVNYSSTPQ